MLAQTRLHPFSTTICAKPGPPLRRHGASIISMIALTGWVPIQATRIVRATAWIGDINQLAETEGNICQTGQNRRIRYAGTLRPCHSPILGRQSRRAPQCWTQPIPHLSHGWPAGAAPTGLNSWCAIYGPGRCFGGAGSRIRTASDPPDAQPVWNRAALTDDESRAWARVCPPPSSACGCAEIRRRSPYIGVTWAAFRDTQIFSLIMKAQQRHLSAFAGSKPALTQASIPPLLGRIKISRRCHDQHHRPRPSRRPDRH